MSGTEKLPMFVIGKSAQPCCFKNVKSLPTTYKANKNAWMTSEIFTERVRKLDSDMTRNQRSIMLIVDNCPAHPKINGLKSVKLVFLPPNSTSVTQPMDQGVIRNLKVHYRKQVITRKIRALDNGTDMCINVLDALRMLHQAWGCVTQATITNCYRRAGFKACEEQVPVPVPLPETDSEEIDDDISLAHLSRLIKGATMEQYVDVDIQVPTCEEENERRRRGNHGGGTAATKSGVCIECV
ncbi:tigger transposable element-derived protein 4-like [Mercenaria mercenaria]|uniref:tigger transposable element-derived protein 4-like n=1 Tax=Mercenaria mercenaria TaxID=6596 RepID=UPI00234EEBD1|nr:tigger transposable element-derived protein 4-like [Mercenaria mercenaria]